MRLRSGFTKNPFSAASFFHLPPEIRDQIYSLAIGPSPLHMTRRRHEIQGYLPSCDTSPSNTSTSNSIQAPSAGLPIWLLTSKQLLHEALCTLSRTHTFRPDPDAWSMYAHPSNRRRGRQLYNQNALFLACMRRVRVEPVVLGRRQWATGQCALEIMNQGMISDFLRVLKKQDTGGAAERKIEMGVEWDLEYWDGWEEGFDCAGLVEWAKELGCSRVEVTIKGGGRKVVGDAMVAIVLGKAEACAREIVGGRVYVRGRMVSESESYVEVELK